MTTREKQTVATPCRTRNHHRSCTDPVRIVFEKSESTPNEPNSDTLAKPVKAVSGMDMPRSKKAIYGRETNPFQMTKPRRRTVRRIALFVGQVLYGPDAEVRTARVLTYKKSLKTLRAQRTGVGRAGRRDTTRRQTRASAAHEKTAGPKTPARRGVDPP